VQDLPFSCVDGQIGFFNVGLPILCVKSGWKAGVPQDGSKPATLAGGKTYTFELQQFDVLNLASVGAGLGLGLKDLTGTRMEATARLPFLAAMKTRT